MSKRIPRLTSEQEEAVINQEIIWLLQKGLADPRELRSRTQEPPEAGRGTAGLDLPGR